MYSVENSDSHWRIEEFAEMSPALIQDHPEIQAKLIQMGYFESPASTKYHGAYAGGLYDHSKEVYFALANLTGELGSPWMRPESPFIIGMFHDLCKADLYEQTTNSSQESAWVHKPTLLTGHGEKSIMLLSTLMQLTEEEMMCIRFHMGAFVAEDMKAYGDAVERFPNVLYTHTADMIASKIKGI